MKLTYSLILAAASCGMAFGAATAYTTPVGYLSQSCLSNSDTVVGVPLRIAVAAAGVLSTAPDIITTPGSAILTLSGTPGLTPGAFANAFYVKFNGAVGKPGEWYAVTANDANTLTVNLNGATITAVSGDALEVLKFWTLGELFNPAVSTSDPTTTGNAIVTSASTSLLTRRTQVLVPDTVTAGINVAAGSIFYITGGVWRKSGDAVNTNYNAQQLWPDTYITIRQPATVATATVYTNTGEVDVNHFQIPLTTRASIKQDNFIMIPRPINQTLNQLNLKDSGAFLASASTSLLTRRDEVLVFNNAVALQNKAASAIYYVTGNVWRKSGDAIITDYGDIADTIPAGVGFIIRKYQTGTGATQLWDSTASY